MKNDFLIGFRLVKGYKSLLYMLFVCFTICGCSGENNSPAVTATEPFPEATPPTSYISDVALPTDISVNLLTGYWANIYQDFDGVDHLNGFYFAEDGTGLIFHSSEGAFLITSYSYSDDELIICFLNMDDSAAEWIYPIHSLSENKFEITYDSKDNNATYAYERMQKIEPFNSLGGYTVTQTDGLVLDIMGY